MVSGVTVLHLAVALAYLTRGIRISHEFGAQTWDLFWQNLPLEDLRDRAVQSLWFLHAQPPLWNALNAVLLKAFGAGHLAALQAVHILLGCAVVAIATLLTAELTLSLRAAAVAGLLVALDPALVLFEAWPLYELLSAFLIMLIVLATLKAGPEGRTGPLLAALALLAALVLTRSLYHLILFLPAILLMGFAARARTSVVVAGIAIALIPTSWYAKNLEQSGFFGSSSWYGIGLWRVALFRYDGPTLQPLLREGKLDPVVTIPPFTAPSAYVRLGYGRTSDVPSLSRDDFHNVNVPAISAAYGRSAKALIEAHPAHFIGNALVGFGNFSAPSTEYALLAGNRERMRPHAAAWAFLTGMPIAHALDRALPFGSLGSGFALAIPLSLLAFAVRTWRRARGDRPLRVVRADLAMIVAASLILYTTLAGSALELGENVRFKFMIEPLLLTFWTVSIMDWKRSQQPREASRGA